MARNINKLASATALRTGRNIPNLILPASNDREIIHFFKAMPSHLGTDSLQSVH